MNDNHQILAELLAAQEAGEQVVLATIVKAHGSVPRHVGTKMLIFGNGRFSGTIGGGEMESRVVKEALACLENGHSSILPYSLVDPKQGDPGVCGGEVEIYLEPYFPPTTIFVIGCGHVGRAVASLAHWLGYRVVVYDDRPELATAANIPNADTHLTGDFAGAMTGVTLTRNTHIVAVTRNVGVDCQILPQLVDSPAPYIGVMGSRRRWQETRKLLLEGGLSEDDLDRFHSPLGLELNAESPEEIAVSILAEIIMLRRDGTGQRMKSDNIVK